MLEMIIEHSRIIIIVLLVIIVFIIASMILILYFSSKNVKSNKLKTNTVKVAATAPSKCKKCGGNLISTDDATKGVCFKCNEREQELIQLLNNR